MSQLRRLLRRRWLAALAATATALGVAAAVVYLTLGQEPDDVSNPDVEFTAPTPTTTAPPEDTRPRPSRFVWRIYGYDPGRTRYLPAGPEPPLRRVWTVGGSILTEFPPVLAKGKLFFVKNNGEAYSVHARDGRTRWRRRVARLNASSPAYSKGRLFIASLAPGRLTALSARNGRILWVKALPSRTESSPIVVRDRVFFGSEDGTVYALRASDGRQIWTHRAAGAVKGALAYHDGRLFFGDYAGQVTALRAEDGSRVWTAGTSGRSFGRAGNFYSSPAVAFGRVYLGNTDGKVYSFGAGDGRLAWTRTTGGYVYGSPAVAAAPRTRPTVYIGSYDGTFYAFDARTGDTRWSHRAGGRISGSATVVGRVVYFSNLAAKSTTGLDVRDGRRVFAFGRGAFNPVISDGERIYLTGYSSLYAFEPRERRARPSRRGERRRGSERRERARRRAARYRRR